MFNKILYLILFNISFQNFTFKSRKKNFTSFNLNKKLKNLTL